MIIVTYNSSIDEGTLFQGPETFLFKGNPPLKSAENLYYNSSGESYKVIKGLQISLSSSDLVMVKNWLSVNIELVKKYFHWDVAGKELLKVYDN